MLRKARERISEEKGFTLIELLVVILIIGILAMIALPAFLGQRQKAQDAEAKTAARSASTAAETHYTDTQNYSTISAASLRTIEPSLNDGAAAGANLTVTPGDQTYTVRVTQTKTGQWYQVAKLATGQTQRSCGPTADKGGCSGAKW